MATLESFIFGSKWKVSLVVAKDNQSRRSNQTKQALSNHCKYIIASFWTDAAWILYLENKKVYLFTVLQLPNS